MNMFSRPYHPTRAKSRGTETAESIILHEINAAAAYIDSMMQGELVAQQAALGHQSFHFVVDETAIRSYMATTEAAFAIPDGDTMTGWSIAAGHPGIDPDLYTINIAVAIGQAPYHADPCQPGCGRTYPPQLLINLQALLNYIGEEEGIDITDTDVVWRHGSELCDLNLAPLLDPVEPPTPGWSDWFCDKARALQPGDNPMIARIVGNDCATYDPPWVVNANDTGRQVPGNLASGANALAGGGHSNTASGDHATVGGGLGNTASGDRATVAGGQESTASGDYATVGGGHSNTASGNYSAILGGEQNDTDDLAKAMIIGSNITAVLPNATHVNRLVIVDIPTDDTGLPPGTVWSDSGTLKIVPPAGS